jgi:hypothetical protein
VGLVAREIEARGLPTVSLSALRKPTLLVHPPRALFTGNPNQQIVGPTHAREAQLAMLRRTLRVLMEATTPGIITDP